MNLFNEADETQQKKYKSRSVLSGMVYMVALLSSLEGRRDDGVYEEYEAIIACHCAS